MGRDTWLNAIKVVPGVGTVVGRVFLDVTGNGIEDGDDTALAGALVEGYSGSEPPVTTISREDGSFELALNSGSVTVVTKPPSGYVETMSTATQLLTVVTGQTTSAAAVGWTPIPLGSGSGRAFLDFDANGIEDGVDGPLFGASVSVLAGSQQFSTTTDIAGNYSIDFVPVGDVQ